METHDLPPVDVMQRASDERDAAYDGVFYIAVRTTRVFCRPTCSARKPLPQNVQYYATATEALAAGFRPCKRCRPVERADVEPVTLRWLESPVGPLLVGATEERVCLLEFTDERRPGTQSAVLRERLGRPVVQGSAPVLDLLADELDAYFRRDLRAFTVPLLFPGSPFQHRVWEELLRIPYGETISYEELAGRVGNPAASRAAGHANGSNRIAIVIPCHRVIAKDGGLGGYGGGLPRKRFLLGLEQGLAESAPRAEVQLSLFSRQ
jgi:methylated-DNA-[protein]-cysteine S-methyltransferase